MSEHLVSSEFPHVGQISLIDAAYGREYDPYPDSRTRNRRQESSQGVVSPASFRNRQQRTPAVTPLSLPSPVPNVYRLTRQDLSHTPTRSPPAAGSFMPAATLFREHDQIPPTRWTQAPTNVSYPASRGPSMMSPTQQSWRADISFAPRHASTPAPSPGGHYNGDGESAVLPGGFREGVSGGYGEHVSSPVRYEGQTHRHYGEPEAVPGGFNEEPSVRYGEREHYTAEPESYVDDSGYPPPNAPYDHGDETRHSDEDMEEEIISRHHSDSNGGSERGRMELDGDEEPRRSRDSFKVFDRPAESTPFPKKGRRFTDRFNLKNIFSRKSSKSGSRQPSPPPSMPSPHPYRPQRTRSQPSRVDLVQQSPSHSPNIYGQSSSRPLIPQSPGRPSNPAPDTTGDMSRSTVSSTSSQRGPLTPDQSAVAPAALLDDANFPNPYEASGIPQPQLVVPSPEIANIRPTEDYDIMSEEPVYESHLDYTFTSRINTIGRFLSELTHLPFKSRDTVTVTYRPGDSHRARYVKPGKSWYTKEHHEKLDLLATPTQVMRSPLVSRPREAIPRQTQAATTSQRTRTAQVTRSPRGAAPTTRSPPTTKPRSLDAATAIRPNPTPGSITTHGGLFRLPSPGLSSHEQGLHSGSVQYLYASPQPLYLVPGTALNQQAAGQSNSAGASALPAAMPASRSGSPHNAVPVYVLTTPGPLATVQVPGTSPKKHRKHSGRSSGHRRRDRKSGSSTSSPPPIPVIPSIPTSRLDVFA